MITRNHILFILFVGFSAPLYAQQAAPELDDFRPSSKNYYEICSQLDAYFAEEFKRDTGDCPDDAYVQYQRWKWFWRNRVQADGSFPDLKAQADISRQLKKEVQNRGNLLTWQQEGPVENTGGGYWGMGRTLHVAIQPGNSDRYYVGTPDGGIWKTTDGGAHYQNLGDPLPYLPVGIILMDYQHPDTLYISLGEKTGWWNYNLGVYKSTDGGQSWNPTGLNWQLSQGKVIYAMEMSPADPAVIFAATNDGIQRTTDGGAHWSNLFAGEFIDIKFRPGDANTLFASKLDYWGFSNVFKSSDGGAHWTQVTNLNFNANYIHIAVSKADPNVVGLMGSADKSFYLSTDAGDSFALKSAAPENAVFNFSQTDAHILYTSGVVVYRSSDSGATWDQITNWYNNGIQPEVHADVHDIIPNPNNSSELFFCNDGGLYKYNENFDFWEDFSNGIGNAQFYRIAVSETGPLKILAGSQDNGGWYRKPDLSWTHTNGGDAMCQAVDPTDPNVMYTEYASGSDIFRSVNSFITYVNIADNIPDNPTGDWVTPFTLNPKNTQTLLVGLDDLYRSYDRGDHFEKISQHITQNVSAKLIDVAYSPADTIVMAAAYGNQVYRSADSGQSWTTTFVGVSTEDITRIAMHPTDAKRMWVTKGGYNAGRKVYKTLNGGVSWVNISVNLPNIPVNCILFDAPSNYLFVGTDIGVFYSDADNIHWQAFGEGLPHVYVFDLKIRQATRILYAGTYGRGVFSISLEAITPVQDLNIEHEIVRIFPNPTNGAVHFASSLPAQDYSLQLYDLTGRMLKQQEIVHTRLDELVFDPGVVPNGIYFLKITSDFEPAIAIQRLIMHK